MSVLVCGCMPSVCICIPCTCLCAVLSWNDKTAIGKLPRREHTTLMDYDRHSKGNLKPLNAELNHIYHLLALFGVHPILHISGVRVKILSLEIFRVIRFCIPESQAEFLFVWSGTQRSVCYYCHLSFFVTMYSLLHYTQPRDEGTGLCYCSSLYKEYENLDLGFVVIR
jgi:hypothetical protein